MNIALLLRFRDLVVPEHGHTINEHRKLATASGYTWWGWWRKQSEVIPEALWSTLRRQIAASEERSARVFLVDSGQRKIYRAKLLDVKFEPGHDGLAPPEEGKLTPNYYQKLDRSAPFASWFKLTDIEDADESELSAYAYERAPHDDLLSLPNERVVGRKIGGVRELLQFGNVTYWVGKLAEEGAEDLGQLHVRMPAAVATDHVIVCKSNRILHLSDLHMGTHHAYKSGSTDAQNPSLAQVVLDAMSSSKRPGLVVVTGDLTWQGTEGEFDLAFKCLDDLRSTLGLTHQHFVIVPGNHDMGWIPATSESEQPTVYTMANADARVQYQAFFRRWYGTTHREDLAVGRRFFLAGGPTLDVLGFNSAALQQHEGVFQGLGRVPETHYKQAVRDMGWDMGRDVQRRMVLTHHHLLPVVSHERPEDAERGFGIALDAGSQIRMAQDFGVDLVLHGHQHHPFAAAVHTTDFIGTREAREAPLLVLGGGSAGVADPHVGPFKHRAFNLLSIYTDKVQVELFAAHRSNIFESISTIESGPGGLWQRARKS